MFRPTSRLSTPHIGPTDACEREQRYPRPGQMALDLPAHGYREAPIVPTTGCHRWGHHFNPTTGVCNRCALPRD